MKYRVILIVGIFLALVSGAVYLEIQKNKEPEKEILQKTYTALGDSVSAGVGLYTASDSSACNRTDESYPFVFAKNSGHKLTNISCSGATIPNGIIGAQNVNGLDISAQLEQLFAANNIPDLVTLTIGANDVNWITILASCYTTTCGSEQDTNAINQSIATLETNLQGVLARIKENYKDAPPQVVTTGYYTVFSPTTQQCSDTIGITTAEVTWLNAQLTKLNSVIEKTTANYSFAKHFTPDFSGHELCSQESWVQGLQERAPYHPNEAGQKEIAQQLQKQLNKN